MNKSFLYLIALVSVVVVACGNPSGESTPQVPVTPPTQEEVQNSLRQQITTLEEQIRDSSATRADKTIPAKLLAAYIDYSNKFHEDTLSGVYLLRGASLADGLGKYQKAIELLTNFHDGYPTSDRRAEAAYLIAFIYDAHIKDPVKATQYYNKVIELYPDSPWAEQARAALRVVNMNNEELLEYLKGKK